MPVVFFIKAEHVYKQTYTHMQYMYTRVLFPSGDIIIAEDSPAGTHCGMALGSCISVIPSS